MKDFHATLTIRNNQLRARREALGLNQSQVAQAAGVSAVIYGQLEMMKVSPVSKGVGFDRRGAGEWRRDALRLAEFYGVLPEDLFPDAVLAIPQSVFEREIDAGDLPELLAPPVMTLLLESEQREELAAMEARIPEVLSTLTPRESEVVRLRFGLGEDPESSRQRIGELQGYSHQGIREIELRALRKLRHPAALAKLRGEEELPPQRTSSRAQATISNETYVKQRAKLLPEAMELAKRERISVTEAVQRLWERKHPRRAG